MVAGGVALALDPDELIAQARERNPELAAQGVTDDLLLGVTIAMIAALVLWCLFTMVVAVFVFRGASGPGASCSSPPARPARSVCSARCSARSCWSLR